VSVYYCSTPNEKHLSYILARRRERWWWCPFCTRPTRCMGWIFSASSLKQLCVCRNVAPLGHIIQISRQPVFALSS